MKLRLISLVLLQCLFIGFSSSSHAVTLTFEDSFEFSNGNRVYFPPHEGVYFQKSGETNTARIRSSPVNYFETTVKTTVKTKPELSVGHESSAQRVYAEPAELAFFVDEKSLVVVRQDGYCGVIEELSSLAQATDGIVFKPLPQITLANGVKMRGFGTSLIGQTGKRLIRLYGIRPSNSENAVVDYDHIWSGDYGLESWSSQDYRFSLSKHLDSRFTGGKHEQLLDYSIAVPSHHRTRYKFVFSESSPKADQPFFDFSELPRIIRFALIGDNFRFFKTLYPLTTEEVLPEEKARALLREVVAEGESIGFPAGLTVAPTMIPALIKKANARLWDVAGIFEYQPPADVSNFEPWMNEIEQVQRLISRDALFMLIPFQGRWSLLYFPKGSQDFLQEGLSSCNLIFGERS